MQDCKVGRDVLQGSVIIISVDGSGDEYSFTTRNVNFRDTGLTADFDCALCRGDGAVFLPELYTDGQLFGGAVDAEPEFIAVSDDGLTAWVTLQENNAIAIISLAGDGAL